MAQFKRLLLTGASGGLGTLLRKEIAPMAEVMRLTNRHDMGEAGPNEEIVLCDLADKEAVMELTRDVDMAKEVDVEAAELVHGRARYCHR